MKTPIFKLLGLAALIVLLVVGHAIVRQNEAAIKLEFSLLDQLFAWRGPRKANNDVVIISIDEMSYKVLSVPMDQAWPRSLHVKLLEKLAQAGAKKVVFDILFIGPSNDLAVDRKLADAMGRLSTVIGADEGVRVSQYGQSTEMLLPFEPFLERATPALVALPESYGAVRHFRLPDAAGALEPSPLNLSPLAFEAVKGVWKEREIPRERDLLNFYGPASYLPSYSYYQILEEAVPFPSEKLKDKIVFVGLELRSKLGPDQKDTFVTSFSENGRAFGLEIHATAAANLLDSNWIRRLSPDAELIVLSVLLAIVTCICVLLKPLLALAFIASITGIWLGASYLLFCSYNLFIPGISVFGLFGPAVFLISTLITYAYTRRSQRQIRKAFALYLSPHMAAQVSKNPSVLGLGGQSTVATAVFTDIAHFTTISEAMSAEETTQMLNDYFSEIVDIIFDSGGTLIKFIGDAVFAIWGAPVKLENHAASAYEAAIQIQQRLQNSHVLKKYPELFTRIGVHTGKMVVGNLGSRKRFDFTAIGDTVNLASRIEGLNKYLGTQLLITESVKQSLSKETPLLLMGKARVVGKTEAVSIYTPAQLIGEDATSAWHLAQTEFALRHWDEAKRQFRAAAERSTLLHTAADYYVSKIGEYEIIPPPAAWSGELEVSSK